MALESANIKALPRHVLLHFIFIQGHNDDDKAGPHVAGQGKLQDVRCSLFYLTE